MNFTNSFSKLSIFGAETPARLARLSSIECMWSISCRWRSPVSVRWLWGMKVLILSAAFWTSVTISVQSPLQGWHASQVGNKASGAYSSQNTPVTPTRQRHSPVSGSHDGHFVPSRLQSQAENKMYSNQNQEVIQKNFCSLNLLKHIFPKTANSRFLRSPV